MEVIGEIRQENKILKLDLKDKKILSLLMTDARINVSDISDKVELSKSNVARRISKLEKYGLIGGYHAFVDVSKLGLETTLILLKTKTTPSKKEKYISKIIKIKEIYTINELIGNFDLSIGIYSKTEEEKNKILDEILGESFIVDFNISNIKTSFPQLSYTDNMFSNINRKNIVFLDKIGKIDEKDKKILLALSKNCRTSSVDLAEKLKLPRATINYRIDKLIQEGIIAKFQPNVNFFMLGLEFYFLRFRLSKPSEIEEIIKYLSNTLRANTILKSNGTYQLMAFLQFKDNSEFRKFEEDILEKFKGSIQDYSFSVAKSQYKLDWFPGGI